MLYNVHIAECLFHHDEEVGQVTALEELCHKVPLWLQHVAGEDQCCMQQLRLKVLINLMQTCYIRCPIAHYQLCFLTFEHLKYCL